MHNKAKITRIKTNDDSVLKEIQMTFFDALRATDGVMASKVIDDALHDGLTPSKIYISVLAPAQAQITKLWVKKELSVVHEHLATQISLQEMTRLRQLIKPKAKLHKRAVIAAVDGDTHYFGPRLIADFLLLDGWDVDFLGVSTPVDDLIKFISSRSVDLVGLAAIEPDSIAILKNAIEKIHQLEKAPKILIGGATVYANMQAAQALGADGIPEDGRAAVCLARKVCGLADAGACLSQYLKGLGERIVSNRQHRNMSQQQLAAGADLDRAYISALENGKQNVTIGAIAKLADALEITLEELLAE